MNAVEKKRKNLWWLWASFRRFVSYSPKLLEQFMAKLLSNCAVKRGHSVKIVGSELVTNCTDNLENCGEARLARPQQLLSAVERAWGEIRSASEEKELSSSTGPMFFFFFFNIIN